MQKLLSSVDYVRELRDFSHWSRGMYAVDEADFGFVDVAYSGEIALVQEGFTQRTLGLAA